MTDQSLTLFPGDTLTIMVSEGQAPDTSADPSAGADPNIPSASADAGTPTPADVPPAPPADAATPPDAGAAGQVVQPPDPLSVGAPTV